VEICVLQTRDPFGLRWRRFTFFALETRSARLIEDLRSSD
jgi:hypothetical protein